MKDNDKYLVIIGVVVCVVIACLSPFIASPDPDGLEKSAEDSNVGEEVAYAFIEPPFPDYTIGDSSIGEIAALVIGIVVTLIIGFGVAQIVKKHNS